MFTKQIAVLGLMFALAGSLCPVQADAVAHTRAEFLQAVKEVAAQDGTLTQTIASGLADEHLVQLGEVVCSARRKQATTAEIAEFVQSGASDYTPANVLMTAAAAAELYFCPELAQP